MAILLDRMYWSAYTAWHLRGQARFPYLPLDEIVALQSDRVRSIVAHAYDTVPYYREAMDRRGLRPRDFRTADDLEQLPILTGEEFAENPARFLSSRYAKGGTFLVQSSGTAGHTKQLRYDPAALFLLRAHRYRQRKVLVRFVGSRFRWRQLGMFSPHGAVAKIGAFYRDRSWLPRILKPQRAHASPEASLDANLAQLNSFKPDVISGYGSYIGLVFRFAHEQSLPIHRPRLVLYSSEMMSDADKYLIETEYGVPVLSTFAAAESHHLAFQCERRQGFHVSIDDVAVRVADDHGRTLASGTSGNLIISCLINRATVLLNYRLGDLAIMAAGPCPCGRTLPVLERIEGRADDFVVYPDGRHCHSAIICQRLQPLTGVVQFQLRQEGLRNFVFLTVCSSQVDWRLLRDQLEAKIRAVLGNDIDLSVERVARIDPGPGGKARMVVSACRR
jgi:phenylacetate-CoA ligase